MCVKKLIQSGLLLGTIKFSSSSISGGSNMNL